MEDKEDKRPIYKSYALNAEGQKEFDKLEEAYRIYTSQTVFGLDTKQDKLPLFGGGYTDAIKGSFFDIEDKLLHLAEKTYRELFNSLVEKYAVHRKNILEKKD